jgi:hypothetical protein
MILEKLTEELADTIGFIRDPVLMTEVLFPPKADNFDSLAEYSPDGKFFKVGLFQLPFFSYEYLIADDPSKSEVENFQMKKGAGDIVLYCGRGIGKSVVGVLIDLALDCIYNVSDWVTAFSSFDEKHLLPIWNPLSKILKTHSFFKLFEYKERRHPTYEMESKIFTHKLAGVNMNLSSKAPGSAWENIHAKKIVIDEHQYETNDVYTKRTHSINPKLGAIERLAGITSFRSNSPAGRIFEDHKKKPIIINLPKYIYGWNEKAKEDAIKKHNGENTLDYKIHVKAEICKDVEGAYPMDRLKHSKDQIKRIEIEKKHFWRYKHKIIVSKPKNAYRTWIASDFGEKVCEIAIVFEINTKPESTFVYAYNITLYNLFLKEHKQVFDYLVEELSPNFLGIDCTDQGGREIYRYLEDTYPESVKNNNFTWVGFAEKIDIGFKKEKGEVVKDKNGKAIMEEERVDTWSVRMLRKLIFEDQRFIIPIDYKFDKEFKAIIGARIGNAMRYTSDISQDHLHQAFQVLGIMIHKNEANFNNPVKKKKWGLGAW